MQVSSRSRGLSNVEQVTLDTYEAQASQCADARSDPDFWVPELEHCQQLLPEGSVLDVGSGNGRDAILLTSRGYQVTGVDISQSLLDIAAEHCPQADFVHGSVYPLPFDDQQFQSAWAAALLLHLPKKKLPQALDEINRVLEPGGIAFVTVKEGQGEEMLKGEFGENYSAFYEEDEMRERIEDAGFEIMHSRRRNAGGADWVCVYGRKPNQIALNV